MVTAVSEPDATFVPILRSGSNRKKTRQSDNLIRVRDISATEAARNFSEVLDAVEHRHETFVVIRKGRSVARITPAVAASGRAVKDLLLAHRPDPTWGRELRTMRSKLLTEERDWNT